MPSAVGGGRGVEGRGGPRKGGRALAGLAASEAPLTRALDASNPGGSDQAQLHYDEAGFRLALNEDAMATDKLAEGIRAFCADAARLDQLLLA
jgi:transaldolase